MWTPGLEPGSLPENNFHHIHIEDGVVFKTACYQIAPRPLIYFYFVRSCFSNDIWASRHTPPPCHIRQKRRKWGKRESGGGEGKEEEERGMMDKSEIEG
jgi:hypothetical protein